MAWTRRGLLGAGAAAAAMPAGRIQAAAKIRFNAEGYSLVSDYRAPEDGARPGPDAGHPAARSCFQAPARLVHKVAGER